MITFGLIAEGATDMTVLENILLGYFNDVEGEKIEVNFLQPNTDETDSFGGWSAALQYCNSDEFKAAFGYCNYLIIQIDTDICEEINITRIGENEKSKIPEFLTTIRTKIIEDYIGIDFFEKYQERIIFALSVHSIECWLLPIYYTDKKKEKISNCLETLNRALGKKNKRYIIHPKNKQVRKYERLSAIFRKHKHLMKHSIENQSFQVFMEVLNQKFENQSQ